MRAVPRVGAREPGEDRDERRLAGAVRPEQAEELALLDGEAHAGERLHAAEAAGDIDDFDGGGHEGTVNGTRRRKRRATRLRGDGPSASGRQDLLDAVERRQRVEARAAAPTNASGRPSAAARRFSASSTATAVESNAPMPPQSTIAVGGQRQRGGRREHRARVGERQRAGERPARARRRPARSRTSARCRRRTRSVISRRRPCCGRRAS